MRPGVLWRRPMRRIIPSLLAIATAALAVPVLAADWEEPGLRDGYPDDWEMPSDVLNFEVGVRYWYAMGTQDISGFGENFTVSDQSHIVEGHFRIDDDSTSS